MKKLFASSFLIFLLTVSLSAKEQYIQVMSISDPNYLNSVKTKINRLGHKSYVKKLGKWNIVYAGPFKNTQVANKALGGIKKNLSKDAFLTKITARAPKKSVKKQTPPAQKKTTPVKKKKRVAEKVKLEDIMPVGEKAPTSTKQKKENKKVEKKVPQKKSNPVEKKEQVKQEKKPVPPSKTEKKAPEETIIVQSKKDKAFYVGLAAGYSLVEVQQSGLAFELEDSGFNISPEIGYYFNNNIFVSLNYQFTDLENVTLNTAFATLNYQLDEFYSISPFIGAIIGYSQRSWEKIPVASSGDIDTVSSLVGGLQLGSDISLSKSLSLYLYYRYLMMDTTTNIYDIAGESKIEYGNEQDLNIGIKYNF